MKNPMYDFMIKTIELASRNPAAPYGAMIVYDDQEILVKSVNSAHNNPVMHGELSVIYELFTTRKFNGDHNRLSLYTTAEPCPMCAAAIYWAMIPKIIYGSSIPFLHELSGRQITVRAAEIFAKTPDFYKYELIGGILEEDCNKLFINSKNVYLTS